MTHGQHNDEQQRLPGEANVPLLPSLANEEERSKEAEKKAENDYKDRQLALATASVNLTTSNRNLTRALAIFTALAAIAASYQGCVASRSATAAKEAVAIASQSLCETQRSNSQQALLAEEARNSSEESSRLDQRAWLGAAEANISFDAYKQPLMANISVGNFGKSPAIHVTSRIRSSFTSVGHPWETSDFVYKYPSSSKGDMSPNMFFTLSHTPDDTDKWKRLVDGTNKGDFVLYLFGEVTYQDIFKRPHWMHTCTIFRKDLIPISCPIYNDTDAETSKDNGQSQPRTESHLETPCPQNSR